MQPSVVVRAPGRVNLIGEHTDYSDLPVMPMAIEHSLFVAAANAPDPTGIVARSREFAADNSWQRYVKVVAAELAEKFPERGAHVFVASDLPAAGGLSSSAALMCGLLAALSAVWNRRFDGDEIVHSAISAEHALGLHNGGMDQQAVVFGAAMHALRIDFRPAQRRLVPVPGNLRFVIASSGERAAKASAARDAFNGRVAGTRLAATILARELGMTLESPPTLGQVAAVDGVNELASELPADVRPYARHVLSEAKRVDAAEAALRATDLRGFGELLDASQASLRDDYGCSTPVLDRLCVAMRSAGAYGARLTGAGFGGFAVAACGPDAVARVIAAALAETGGPAFEVHASGGLEWL